MSAPPSPAFSEISINFCCSEEGSDGNADSDYCSPQLKRAKLYSAQPNPREEVSLKKKLFNGKFLSGVKEVESRLSTSNVSDRCCGIECCGNSSHSLPTLDFKEPSHSVQFDRRLSLESVRCYGVESGNNSSHFERRSSLEEEILVDRVAEAEQAKNNRKARVVSSHYNHLKENQQLVGSDQGSCKTDLTASTPPSRFADGLQPTNKVLDKETVNVNLDLSEITYESGEDAIRGVHFREPPETLICSRDHCENWSTTNSLQEDDVPPKSTETAEPTDTARTPGHAGDSQSWNSHIEKEYKNELEFSTLVTLAYVRVRDLTNTITKASSYLEALDKKDVEDTEEANQLRSEIQAMFDERAKLALEHSKWRSEFSQICLQRKKVWSNLKSQAALAEQSYFKLRKELEDLQNEPIVAKPKRTWFSRLCAFIK